MGEKSVVTTATKYVRIGNMGSLLILIYLNFIFEKVQHLSVWGYKIQVKLVYTLSVENQ